MAAYSFRYSLLYFFSICSAIEFFSLPFAKHCREQAGWPAILIPHYQRLSILLGSKMQKLIKATGSKGVMEREDRSLWTEESAL